MKKNVLVIGSGAFGSSMGQILSSKVDKVWMHTRRVELCEQINIKHESEYLIGKKLSSNMHAFTDLKKWSKESLKEKDFIELVVIGLPTKALKEFIQEHRSEIEKLLSLNIPFVSLTKGIDPETLELPDEIWFRNFPSSVDQFVFLSGPSFAEEIMEKHITVVSLAGRHKQTLEKVSALLETNYFKAFCTYDIKGVLLGGALKNVLAIASGIVEGLGFNHNTRAALITRGITEMLRFGVVFNARPETFFGHSGMGDLILTATGGPSRNRAYGLSLARGESIDSYNLTHKGVVEGHYTALSAQKIIERYDIRAKLFTGVYKIIYEGLSAQEVLKDMMSRPSGFESLLGSWEKIEDR